MKKIYLCALALSLSFVSFGQTKKNIAPQKFTTFDNVAKGNTLAPQDKGITVWSDDFSNQATWIYTNSSNPAQDWIYTTDPAVIPVLQGDTVNFTTKNNGYLYIDSDAIGGGTTQNLTAETATPINLGAYSTVSLSWEQDYISFQEIFTVSVSGDNGNNWTDYNVVGGGAQARVYEEKNINISAVAGGQSQVLVRFTYTGAWDWMWAIDDVKITVTDDNDLEAGLGWYGFGPNGVQYTRLPQNQLSGANFSMYANNVGSVDQPNTVLTAYVNATPEATSAASTVNVGANDSLFTTGTYTPPATTGVPLNITLDLASDSVDASQANNGWAFPALEVSAFVYAVDDYGTMTDGGGYNSNATPPTEDFEAGSYYDVINNDNVYAIDVGIGPGTLAGAIYDVVLYDASGTGFVEIARSNAQIVAAGDEGTIKTVNFQAPVAVNAGTVYFAAVHGWGGTTFEFFYGRSGTSVDNSIGIGATSLIFYPSMTAPNTGENFYTTRTPTVRLNFDPGSVGINEISKEVKFNVYPNPSAGVFNISLNSNTSENVNLSVKNVVGQTIINRTIAVAGQTNETVSLTDYSKGIYFLTIDGNTTKLIVE